MQELIYPLNEGDVFTVTGREISGGIIVDCPRCHAKAVHFSATVLIYTPTKLGDLMKLRPKTEIQLGAHAGCMAKQAE